MNLKSLISKRKLRSKVWIALLIISLVQAVLIGVVIYLSNSKVIIESEKENLDQLIHVVNQDLESRVDTFNSNALDIAINNDLKQQLNKSTYLDIGKARRSIVDYLNSKAISTRGLLDISIIDMNSNVYSVRATYYLPSDFSIEETDIFHEASKYNGGLIWLSQNEVNEAYAKDSILLSPLGGISGAAILKDYSSNEIKGLLVVVIKDDYFADMDYSNRKLSNISPFLVSPDKAIVLPINSTNDALNDEILERVDTDSKKGSFIEKIPNTNDEYLVSYIKNNAMGWYLVSVSRTSDLSATFNQIIKILIITLLLSLIACFFIASGISKYVTKGLQELAGKMERVGQGDFNVTINSNRSDEIGKLSNVFDNMVKNTKRLIKLKYEQELLTKEAELKALQAQINPHFLHNTLDMINWRLIEKGEEEISQSIVALGNLLNYSIHGNFMRASLTDEVLNAEDYLFLRYENSNNLFEYEISVDEGEEIILPKLTLQPLVENAVIHGFAGRQRGNRIHIKGFKEGDKYTIEVTDNGIGISEEMLARINSQSVLMDKKEHIGLRNVKERITHMYGEEAELVVLSRFGYGTTIRIIVPKEGVD